MTRFTDLVCLEKNLQNAEPKNAHTKVPDAPIRVRAAVKPASAREE